MSFTQFLYIVALLVIIAAGLHYLGVAF